MATQSINFWLSPAQKKILNSHARFKVVRTGRQFGKSHMGAVFVIIQAMSKKHSVGWIVAPVFRQAVMLLDKVRELCDGQGIKYDYNKTEMTIYFPLTRSKVCAMSGDDPDKIRGQTLDYLIIDEAAFLKSNIYEEHLEPMVAVRNAPVIFISTPYGRNWYYDLYKYAESGVDSDYEAFHFTSHDNPLMPKDFLEKVEKKVDPLKYRQEYLAEWLEEGGLVFNHFELQDLKHHPVEGRIYMAGLDLGKHVDYTVMTIADVETFEIVEMYRFTKTDWETQATLIKEYCERYHNCSIFMDSTGVGDSMVDRLKLMGLMIHPKVFTNTSKTQMIQNLVVMLQNEELKVPNVKEAIDEFERFEYTLLQSGGTRYSAPSGKHDDIVCSMALLAWGLNHTSREIGGFFKSKSSSKVDEHWSKDDFEWTQDEFDWSWE